MELDDKDRALLALLEENCRLSNADMAERVGMSTSACWRRIKAYEEAGLIRRYGAVLDRAAMGMQFHAIVHVQLHRHDADQGQAFNRAVRLRDEVRDCYATTGEADYHLRVRCADLAAYNRFLEEFLFRSPAVRSAQTNVILRDIKG